MPILELHCNVYAAGRELGDEDLSCTAFSHVISLLKAKISVPDFVTTVHNVWTIHSETAYENPEMLDLLITYAVIHHKESIHTAGEEYRKIFKIPGFAELFIQLHYEYNR